MNDFTQNQMKLLGVQGDFSFRCTKVMALAKTIYFLNGGTQIK
jgi:hypothetical protein